MMNQNSTNPTDAASQPIPPPATDEEKLKLPTEVPADVPVEEEFEEETPIELKPEIMRFVLSDHYLRSVESVKSEFKLNDEDSIFIDDLDRLVMAGDLDLESYLVALEDEFKNKIPDADRDRMYARLLAERFVPLNDALQPSAEEVAKAEGLQLPAGSYYRVYLKPLSFSGTATEVSETAGLSSAGGPLRDRLRNLILEKVKNKMVDAQIMETLTRGLDFGGLGLEKSLAVKVLAVLNDILSRAQIMSEEEYSAWLTEKIQPKATVQAGKPQRPPSPEDAEIEAIKQDMHLPAAGVKGASEQAVDAIVTQLGPLALDEYLTDRLRNAVSSRLRDVRSEIEFRQLLARSRKVGGLELDEAKVNEVAGQVEQGYQKFHTNIAGEEKQKIEVQLAEQKQKIEERRGREAQERAAWFEEKIKSRSSGEAQALQGLNRLRSLETREAAKEQEKFGPMLEVPAEGQSTVKVSSATVKLEQTQAAAPSSLDSITPATKSSAPKLVGLVGELGSMNMEEFRRLDREPATAAQKILQKIQTLAQESLEKRLDGIKSFRASPLQTTYVSLMGESFRTGKPVLDLAAAKRQSGENTLSPDEVRALLQINSQLNV
jgi:hypothetical protein